MILSFWKHLVLEFGESDANAGSHSLLEIGGANNV
jgi:hypothetical protein